MKRRGETKRAGNEEKQAVGISQAMKFRRLRKFNPAATALPSATPTKHNTKNYENMHKRMRKCNQN